jgi:hypothetical protein
MIREQPKATEPMRRHPQQHDHKGGLVCPKNSMPAVIDTGCNLRSRDRCGAISRRSGLPIRRRTEVAVPTSGSINAIGRDKEIRSDAVAAAAVVYEHGVSDVKHICTLGRRYDGRYGSRAVSRISEFDCQSPNAHSIVFCDDHESVFALVRHGMGFEISLCGPAVNES